MNYLAWRAVAVRERSSERFVPADDFRQAAFEGCNIQLSGQPESGWDVVEGGFGIELIQEPEPLLGEGERYRSLALRRNQRRSNILLFSAGIFDSPGQLGNSR